MKKLYRLYLALALFALIVASVALVLHRHVARTYASSVAASARAMKRANANERMQELAGDVDAPGNDVFDDGQVDEQERRMEVAARTFAQAMARERRQIIAEEPPSEEKAMLA